MVVKITSGCSVYGVLRYNMKGEVLATNELVEDPECGGMSQWLAGFQPYMDANRNTRQPVIHISLNPHPDDTLSREEYAALAADYMERMGYGQQPYVVFLHTDIDRQHLHIVSLRVDARGHKIDHSFERRRSNEIRKELEKEYGLRATGVVAQEIGTGNEVVDTVSASDFALPKVDYPRGNLTVQIEAAIKSVCKHYRFSTFGEFSALLGCCNVAAWLTQPHRGVVYSALKPAAGQSEMGVMEAALSTNRIGNPLKSSAIGTFAGLDNIEKLCAANKKFLQDPARRKALADRILRAVSGITSRPKTERLPPNGINLSQSEVERRLSEAGIKAVFHRNTAGRLTGATFIDHTTRTVYNGSALDKKLSANNWNELFAENRPSAADHPTIPTSTDPSADHPTMSPPADPPTRGEQFADEPIIIDTPSPEQYSYFEDTTLVSPRYEHDERSDDYEHYEYDTDPTRTTFRGLSHPSHTPEEIDPEFRTLHKRKKQRRKMR